MSSVSESGQNDAEVLSNSGQADIDYQFLNEIAHSQEEWSAADARTLCDWLRGLDPQNYSVRRSFLRALFMDSGSREKVSSMTKIRLDDNGLAIKIGEGGKVRPHHYPIRFLRAEGGEGDNEFIHTLFTSGLLSEPDYLEIMSDISDGPIRERFETQQMELLGAQIGEGEPRERILQDVDAVSRGLGRSILEGYRIPKSLIRELLTEADPEQKQHNIVQLLRCAEMISWRLANSSDGQQYIPVNQGHQSEPTSNRIAKERSGVLHEPAYHEVSKIISSIIEFVPELSELAFVFRGRFAEENTKKKGQQKNAQEMIAFAVDGKLFRVLLVPEKQIKGRPPANIDLRVQYADVAGPLLERYEFQWLEGVFEASHAFEFKFQLLKNFAEGTEKDDWDEDSWEHLLSLAEACAEIVLTELPSSPEMEREPHRLAEMLSSFRSSGIPLEHLSLYATGILRGLEEIRDNYLSYLMGQKESKGLDTKQLAEQLAPKPQREEVSFDAAAAEKAEGRLRSYQFEKDLYQGQDVQFVYPGNLEKPINYGMERKALSALGLRQGHVISVIGGCKYLQKEKEGAIETFVDRIWETAQKHSANVSIPATQSGISVPLSRRYIESNKGGSSDAKMFSIGPGKSLFFEENRYKSAPDFDQGAYAPAPVPQVLSPFRSEWNIPSPDSQYVRHIEYMELIYRRIAKDHKRINIVGNGGLFTIAELNAALRGGSYAILVRGTGRFADIAIRLIEAQLDPEAPDFKTKVLEQVSKLPEDDQESFRKEEGKIYYWDQLREFLGLSQKHGAGKIICTQQEISVDSSEIESIIDSIVTS